MFLRGMARGRAGALRWAIALGLLAAARSAAAQAGVWSTHGPPGGNIYCVVPDPTHPSTVYAGTDQGVFKSDDAGSSWRAANAGMPADRVQTIAIDPTSSSTLYAGTLTPDGVDSVGIFKSTDAGASWTAINEGLIDPLTGISPLDVWSLAIDPHNPGTILAGSRFSEIFKSTDGGQTWQNKTLGGYNVALETSAFQFNASSPSTILAASTQGLLRSTDGGESWDTYGNAGVSFFSLVPDPNSAATLYAGNISGSGIFKSTDGGAHWSAMNKNLNMNQDSSGSFWPLVVSLAVDPSHPSTIYAGTHGNGLFQSMDGAVTWAPVNSGMRSSYVWAVALAPGSSTVYAGTLGGGVYQSSDGARTWTPTNNNLYLSLVSSLVADTAPGTLYAATSDGVSKTTDGGGSWQAANSGLPVAPVSALVLDPGSPRTLLAGTLGGGLLKSSDGGGTWTAGAQGLTDSFIASIAVDPSNPSTVYAGTAHPDTTQSERVFKSTDGGSTWTQTTLDAKSSSVGFLAVNPAKPSQIVAVSGGSIDYFQSLDSGKTWSTIATDTICGGVNAVLFDPSGSTTYLAGTAGVCRSTDGGKTWLLTTVGNLASVQILSLDPLNPSTLYAGASPTIAGSAGGVFRSTDGGQTWQAIGTGLEAASVVSLAFDALGNLHAGTRGNGVAELVFPQDRQPVQSLPSSGRQTKTLTPR